MYKKVLQQIVAGEPLCFDAAVELASAAKESEENLQQLLATADELRQKLHGSSFDLCSIVNARSGKCSENCKFCAQSAHYDVEVESYDVVDLGKVSALAYENEMFGVRRFSLVTAGHHVSSKDLEQHFSPLFTHLQQNTSMSLCASMGFLTKERAELLYAFGVRRYHCNLEACSSYFPEVCTTHSWEEKVETLKIARAAGMELCSGGILGIGESLKQRLELAFELRELGVESVPINILMPIKNTPFATISPIAKDDVLIAAAMFRLILPTAVIRIAGGRNHLGSEQRRLFTSGINGAIVGNYLTTSGSGLAEDVRMLLSLGFELTR